MRRTSRTLPSSPLRPRSAMACSATSPQVSVPTRSDPPAPPERPPTGSALAATGVLSRGGPLHQVSVTARSDPPAPPERPPTGSALGVTGVLELAGPLVLGERVDQLVELAVAEHPVELVQRQADAVVGDAVLLEVVGADLL